MENIINAYELDWNPSTAEGYNDEKKEVYLIFNLDIKTESKVNNVIQYVVGRVVWVSINFPPEASILISFDFRGQGIIISKARAFKDKVLGLVKTIEVINNISIDFLI